MQIAYTTSPGRGDTDLILHQVAVSMVEAGYRPSGTVQINSECAEAGHCDMDVMVLPKGPTLRISQSLGAKAKGCRLDPAALETAVGLVQATLAQSDCLIVNKFGKHEADGRGFRPVIGEAIALGLPVLVGLNRLNTAPFEAFTEGMAEKLSPVPGDIEAWLTDRVESLKQAL